MNPNDNKTQVVPFMLAPSMFPPGIISPRMLCATPTQAKGDQYYSNGSDFVRLPIGSNGSLGIVTSGVPAYLPAGSVGQVLTMSAGAPSWQTPTTAYLGIVDTTHAYQVQSGIISPTAIAANADTDITVTLPQAWPTAQIVFIGSVFPLSTWSGVFVRGTGFAASSKSTGLVHIQNGTTAQNFSGSWISIGY